MNEIVTAHGKIWKEENEREKTDFENIIEQHNKE